jgi:uncharacterized protein (DUF305 family)
MNDQRAGSKVMLMQHGKILAALGIAALTGLVLAAFALAIDPPAERGMEPARVESNAFPTCSSAIGRLDTGFYAEMADVNARMHQGMEITPSGNIDRDFARMMIPHHQGAIDMARLLLKYGQDKRLKRLAQSIIVEQGQEIAYMRSLLDAPAQASPRIADQ